MVSGNGRDGTMDLSEQSPPFTHEKRYWYTLRLASRAVIDRGVFPPTKLTDSRDVGVNLRIFRSGRKHPERISIQHDEQTQRNSISYPNVFPCKRLELRNELSLAVANARRSYISSMNNQLLTEGIQDTWGIAGVGTSNVIGQYLWRRSPTNHTQNE